MTEKLRLREAVIVEGRYDKIKLSALISTPVIETGGFRVFSDKEKQELIRAIAATQRAKKRRIGLYSTLPVMEYVNPQTKRLVPTWWSIQQIEHQFTIVPFGKLEELPPDLDLLMLVHPKGLTAEQEEIISNFLQGGGALIALLDPLSRADVQRQGRLVPPQPSTLPNLLQEWGVTFHHTKVVADRTIATPMTNTRRGMETLPTLLTLRTGQLSQTSPLTAHLENLTMFCAGAFDFVPRDGIKVTPLATTTTDSRLLAIYEAQRNAGEILTDFQPDDQAHHVALLVEAPTAKALLVGDADFLHNSLCINQTENLQGEEQEQLVSDNATLLTNAAEYLCADNRLLRIRSRGRQPRTFQRIEQLARQTELRIQELDAETYRNGEDIRQQLRQLAAESRPHRTKSDLPLRGARTRAPHRLRPRYGMETARLESKYITSSFQMPYFSNQIRVAYADTDQMGIVYHSNYLRYFEISRTEMLRSQGLVYRDLETEGVFLQVVHCELDFHHPAHYDDLLEVRSVISQLGKASLVISSEVWHDGNLLVTGRVKLAAVARNTGRIAPLTARLTAAIRQYLETPMPE